MNVYSNGVSNSEWCLSIRLSSYSRVHISGLLVCWAGYQAVIRGVWSWESIRHINSGRWGENRGCQEGPLCVSTSNIKVFEQNWALNLKLSICFMVNFPLLKYLSFSFVMIFLCIYTFKAYWDQCTWSDREHEQPNVASSPVWWYHWGPRL